MRFIGDGDPVHGLMAPAHAATNCYWLSLATASASSTGLQSAPVGSDGIDIAVGAPGTAELVVGDFDLGDPRYEIALRRAGHGERVLARGKTTRARSRSLDRTQCHAPLEQVASSAL